MKNAIYAPNFGGFGCVETLVDLAVLAEKSGFDGFFLWDHINISGREVLDTVDPTVALSAIISATESIFVGPIVTPLARRRPWKISRELVSLDRLSKGRLIFGAGLGEPPEFEFKAFGEDASPKIRAKKVDESLTIIDKLCSGNELSFKGEFYNISDVQFNPVAFQDPRFPIWIAATLPATAGLKRAVKWDGVFPVSRPQGKDQHGGWADWLPSFEEFNSVVDFVKNSLDADRLSEFDFVASVVLGDKKVKGTSISEFKSIGATWVFHWIDEAVVDLRSAFNLIKSDISSD